VKRTDFEVQNDRSHQIRCSRYFYDDGRTRPTVIFLHGNAGSRLAALRYLHDLLSVEADLVCFDFSGSGLSDG
jgi:pimeloyl-ACP methyl ester carboxylesterase